MAVNVHDYLNQVVTTLQERVSELKSKGVMVFTLAGNARDSGFRSQFSLKFLY